ncbi:hypothetical protein [Microbacterium sp. LMI1-1-1.1]|uniref:hypothetical protein n=1 Tax=Microbacterium sp. LMI1-1-1.1 TaxID=3135223 RepID=UPI003466B1AE
MNTSAPTDPRSLAHRLTTVGHALHHRLFAQLRDSGLHPKTVLVLSVIDGRIDAPWISDRIARGGKRLSALADRGWIAPADDGWTLTDEGREVLERMDADKQALLAEVPAEEIERLTAALDVVSSALGLDEDEAARGPRGRGPRGFGFGPGSFGPGAGRGSGPGFGSGERRGFGGPRFDDGDGDEHGRERGRHEHRGSHGRGPCHENGHRHDRGQRHGRGQRVAESAYERGFDAGFSRGRESAASE